MWLNLLSQYSPAIQSPSDPGTNLLQGLLLGLVSEVRQLWRPEPGSEVPDGPCLKDCVLNTLHFLC